MKTNTEITSKYAELSISRQVDINSLIDAISSQPEIRLNIIIEEWLNR